MRIGVLWEGSASAAYYRAIGPTEALHERGHEVRWPRDPRAGTLPLDVLAECDVVLVYRLFHPKILGLVSQLARRGVPCVYDQDDDYSLVPSKHPAVKTYRRAMGGGHPFDATLRMARAASVVTVATEPIAATYRRRGIADVRVIPNAVRPQSLRPPLAHDGVVIGWVAGDEHAADVRPTGVGAGLQDVLRRHEDVRVEVIGVDLRLPSARYRHQRFVPFEQLPAVTARWDVGLAALADTPFNRARSDIKLKEYGACGMAWAASPAGPYRPLGRDEGGVLVPDGQWGDALDRLVRESLERKRLAQSAAAWARRHMTASTADRWEAALRDAVDGGRKRRQQSEAPRMGTEH